MIKNKQWLIRSIKNDLKYGFNFEYEKNKRLWEKYILEDDVDLEFVGLKIINKEAEWDYQTVITANINYYILFNNEYNEKITLHIRLTKLVKDFWKPWDYRKKGGK